MELSRQRELPDDAWFRVAAHLQAHELLGRMMVLSVGHATLLADARCWSTLALTPCRRRTERMLNCMMASERAEWTPVLRKVQILDISLEFASAATVGLFRDLVFSRLSLEGCLCRLRARRIPMQPVDDVVPVVVDSEDPLEKFERVRMARERGSLRMVQLVNPVTTKAGPRPLFLLEPSVLAQLRCRMSGFGHFSLRADVHNGRAVDFTAVRGQIPDPLPSGVAELIELELGSLWRALPSAAHTEDNFKSWSSTFYPVYEALLAGWRQDGNL